MNSSLTVIVTAINESEALEETIEILIKENNDQIRQILIVTSNTLITNECDLSVKKLQEKHPTLIKVIYQRKPGVGSAILEAVDHVETEFFIYMASDLETDPHLVKLMIKAMDNLMVDVVSISRWINKRAFKGYHPIKFFFNKLFQLYLMLLFSRNVTDYTYGFRMYRTDKFKKVSFDEKFHAFFLESMLKPTLLKFKIAEISGNWCEREDNKSTFHISEYLKYIKVSINCFLLKSLGRL